MSKMSDLPPCFASIYNCHKPWSAFKPGLLTPSVLNGATVLQQLHASCTLYHYTLHPDYCDCYTSFVFDRRIQQVYHNDNIITFISFSNNRNYFISSSKSSRSPLCRNLVFLVYKCPTSSYYNDTKKHRVAAQNFWIWIMTFYSFGNMRFPLVSARVLCSSGCIHISSDIHKTMNTMYLSAITWRVFLASLL